MKWVGWPLLDHCKRRGLANDAGPLLVLVHAESFTHVAMRRSDQDLQLASRGTFRR